GRWLLLIVGGDSATGGDSAMHTQCRQSRFERFASNIIEIDIDSVRRTQFKLVEYRPRLVIERDIKSAIFQQKPDLFRGTGRTEDATPAQLRQLPGYAADGACSSRNINRLTGLDLDQIQPDPSRHARQAKDAQVERERLDFA